MALLLFMRFTSRLVAYGPWLACPLLALAAAALIFSPRGVEGQAPPAIPLRIIVVASSEQAQTILDRLHKGEDFATLAEEVSIDPTANQGGYVGTVDPSSLRAELRRALEGVAPGELTRVVQIPAGYAILNVLKEAAGAEPPAANPTPILPLAAAGNVRLAPDISGFGYALAAMQVSMPKVEDWGNDLKAVCETRQEAIPIAIRKVQSDLADKDADPTKLLFTHVTLGALWAYEGTMDNVIEQWDAAYAIATSHGLNFTQNLREALATAYLHRASLDDHGPGSGIDKSRLFPTRPGASHPRLDDIRKAIELFSTTLERDPNNVELRWLLNFSYMEAGWYPDKVPHQYLIPPERFQSQADIGRFVDVAPAAGLNTFGMAGGVIIDDFDNDGLLDVVTSEMNDCAPLHFFHNNGDGTFSNRTAQAKLSDQLGGLNLVQADYNNDGCVDILVLRGAWEFPTRLSLLRNNCDGTFTDVTEKSGLARAATQTQTAVWADIDNDGKLDLFVTNENAPAQLFLNKGDGTFEDISHSAGVDKVAFSKAVVAGDYDNDGYPDFYVSNMNGENFLYHNNGNRTFTEVAAKAGVQGPWTSFAAWFFDYDNDGLPDLFVTSYYMSIEETARGYLGLPRNGETLKLYKNLGNGTFRDVSAEVGLNRMFMPMGSNFGDVNNDGFLDIYLGNGNPSYASLVPNVLLLNREGKSFVDVTTSSGTGAVAKGHGVAFADLGNNGRQDIFVVMGGATPGDRHTARLFENPGNTNDWIALKLVGVKSNRSAIGARIKVSVTNAGHEQRSIYRTVGSGGSFGASPLEQHIGLGNSARIEEIEVWWPASGTRQKFANVPANQFFEIKEFATTYTKLNRRSFRLGGSRRTTAVTAGSPSRQSALHQ